MKWQVDDERKMKVARKKKVKKTGAVTLRPCHNCLPRLHNYECYR